KKLREEAHSCRDALSSAVSQDMNAYQAVMQAYVLPKATEGEKKRRREEIQKALRKAADPPLFTAATSLKVLKLCEAAVDKGNPNALTDAAVGALLAHAALQGGLLNVLVNLSALDDRETVSKMRAEANRLEAEAKETAERILSRVKEQMKKQ
ncbi:MAG TPA: cyclodeaminase/cyclohydrolase family protein, partial [Thermodesulfobacteriota bacterium]|nr:cyclodeaminase/cyclohydrolase family protein [Thermodesulfobacteriota bacterium]